MDPTQLPANTASLKQVIAIAIRLERDVISLYAVGIRDNSNQIRLLKVCASPNT